MRIFYNHQDILLHLREDYDLNCKMNVLKNEVVEKLDNINDSEESILINEYEKLDNECKEFNKKLQDNIKRMVNLASKDGVLDALETMIVK